MISAINFGLMAGAAVLSMLLWVRLTVDYWIERALPLDSWKRRAWIAIALGCIILDGATIGFLNDPPISEEVYRYALAAGLFCQVNGLALALAVFAFRPEHRRAGLAFFYLLPAVLVAVATGVI